MRILCTSGYLRLRRVNSSSFAPSSSSFCTLLLEKQNQVAVRFVDLLEHLVRLLRQKEIFPTQAPLDILLQTCLRLVQKYPSTAV